MSTSALHPTQAMSLASLLEILSLSVEKLDQSLNKPSARPPITRTNLALIANIDKTRNFLQQGYRLRNPDPIFPTYEK
jgi:hypothetical protein